ncbi:thioredoxin-like protein [Athelia psychrophila]|uniref:Thioredoxin-like protein n=1 Tax=Athelia psychrophila TaxID=1759441 RepID=A0A166CE35_9AGAM|nr:thioredoxin-like protein [Fibularhizoctonia sp. CBS 109695]
MSTTTSPRLIKIIVFSDFVCPYNYIGHNALTTALEQCADQPLQFEIEYKPFRLNSDLPIEPPVDRAEFFGNKFGARYEPARAMFKGMADSLGLPLAAGGPVSQTTRAHRLSLKAYKKGGQTMQQAVIQAYFSAGCGEGKDIGNLEVLADIAVAAGVMPRQCALDFLAGDEFAAEVEQLIAQARASGIRGSPVVIVDGKFKLDGVQTTDTYVQVFRRLGKCAKACAAAAATVATATSGSPTYSETSSDGTISPPLRSTAVAV